MARHLYFVKGQPNVIGKGYMYAVVHLVLHNDSHGIQDYNSFDFALHGRNDNVNYSDYIGAPDVTSATLVSGKLRPGDTVAGDRVFKVPTAKQGYALQWTPDPNEPYIDVPINR